MLRFFVHVPCSICSILQKNARSFLPNKFVLLQTETRVQVELWLYTLNITTEYRDIYIFYNKEIGILGMNGEGHSKCCVIMATNLPPLRILIFQSEICHKIDQMNR